ncbi:hypothetical protein [Mucilaginibacter paludis]|uniref:Uncharacterized protein n=1 Tax=Mucilaginibacter paludis DSM 18603 TaxID=714943 RepID=H1Y7I1_9SPHI|nr:hypothetical protein [Mucilaginibacter paludis]EHQ29402.1 hypothetical protein Mucpa_5328 [Mucilaginibacter paludis DSM 18603]
MMHAEQKNQFVKIQDTLIRISKIDSVKTRHIVKANNFGNISDESLPELIISAGTDKYVFMFEDKASQQQAFTELEMIIMG